MNNPFDGGEVERIFGDHERSLASRTQNILPNQATDGTECLRANTTEAKTTSKILPGHITANEIIEALKNAFPWLKEPDQHGPNQHALDLALQTGRRMKKSGQEHTSWIIYDTNVQKWYESQGSRALVIDGDECTKGRITPLSFFCSLLVRHLQRRNSTIVLHHFCSLHGSKETSSANASTTSSGLIQEFLYQFIKQWNFGELQCLAPEDAQILRTMADLSPNFLFMIFEKLVESLPHGQPVFLIIDGISFYENQESVRATKSLVKRLVKLLDAKASVKLLITGIRWVRYVGKYFEKDEMLFVPDNPSAPGITRATDRLEDMIS